MKLALITDNSGFGIVDRLGLAYHLPLAKCVLENRGYASYYRCKHEQGHFLIMDNGAAEEGALSTKQLIFAAESIGADEVILPDVIKNMRGTIYATMRAADAFPKRVRAVCPQGKNLNEWFECAKHFVDNLDFVTMCIPKHTETFASLETGIPIGRVLIMNQIREMGWHEMYNIHLLGVHENAFREVGRIAGVYPWVRGIDTAAPFAWAQHERHMFPEDLGHFSHVWNKPYNQEVAYDNAYRLSVHARHK